MYDTEKTLYRHYGYIQKETSLYVRWFQKRGLSYPQFLILDAVLRRPEGAEPTALAEECFMPKQTVTGLLDQLERAGFIRRERCETDRRRTRVFCLPAGDEDFDPRAALDLTRITYTRLLADLQAADASVWINRRSVAALVPQLWGAIADVMPGSRAKGRLSSVLRLALALYAMASASVFIEGDDLVLDER